MSSRIQIPRPYVPTTRSLPLITASRYDVVGRFRLSDCQCAPSSKDTYMPLSVPAKSSPAFLVSARRTRAKLPLGSFTGRPVVMRVHVCPKSCVRYRYGMLSPERRLSTAAYAPAASVGDASIDEMTPAA